MPLESRHVDQVCDAVLAALGRDAVVAILIVGSYARGEEVRSSDLDVMVRCHRRLDLAERGRLEEAFKESDLPLVVDVVDFHAVEVGRRAAMLVGSRGTYP